MQDQTVISSFETNVYGTNLHDGYSRQELLLRVMENPKLVDFLIIKGDGVWMAIGTKKYRVGTVNKEDYEKMNSKKVRVKWNVVPTTDNGYLRLGVKLKVEPVCL